MVKSTYQLITLGNYNKFHDVIIQTLYKRIEELGMSKNLLELINSSNFAKDYRSNNPVVAIYYGGKDNNDLDIVETLKANASFILPVFNQSGSFHADVPELLQAINSVKIESEIDIDAFVNNILEGFSLLRLSRRLFISYKRNESRGVAIQLFEKLEEAGFDVFLDTHSIRKGDIFQEELWHRLVDTDIVVLLNTPSFLSSEWTTEELAKANSMSIGIVQLVWPENTPERVAELSLPIKMVEADFVGGEFSDVNSILQEDTVAKIVQEVEVLRARSLAARQDNLITEFVKSALANGSRAMLQPEKYLTLQTKTGKELIVIPTIGVPHAYTYHQSENLIKLIKSQKVEGIHLLYDHRNIREKWQQHLVWLDQYLPVGSVKVTDLDNWIKSKN